MGQHLFAVGWRERDSDAPLTRWQAVAAWRDTMWTLRGLGMLIEPPGERTYALTEVGRAMALHALRHVAAAPRTSLHA